MSYRKVKIVLNGREYEKIEIIQYPSNLRDKARCKSFPSEQRRTIATERCVEIIAKHNQIRREQLLENKPIRIYCPLHENLQTSNTKSGQLFVRNHRYICYSSKCVLPINQNGKRLISTLKFLEYIKKI